MTTSYSKNMHLSNLFVYYALDSQVSLSSYMSIKTVLFFFLTFCCIIILISGIIDHYCFKENLKKIGRKSEQIKNNIP